MCRYIKGKEKHKNLPDRLVGNDNLVPLLLAQLLSGGIELAGHDFDSLVGFALLLTITPGVSGMHRMGQSIPDGGPGKPTHHGHENEKKPDAE